MTRQSASKRANVKSGLDAICPKTLRSRMLPRKPISAISGLVVERFEFESSWREELREELRLDRELLLLRDDTNTGFDENMC